MQSKPFAPRIFEILPADKWQQHTMLLGVSGGADSVAMLRMIHEISTSLGIGKLVVCHANHQLRGPESDFDEKFVGQLCDKLEIPFESHALPPAENDASDGIEAVLRHLRYKMFRDLANKYAARYLLTAHTVNDQTETILFRLLRGTGIAGLAGIPTQRTLCHGVTLVRPLLNIHREEIVTYLNELGQEFRTDSSNAELNYSRNKIRHQLIPLIQTEFECNIDQRLKSLAVQAHETQIMLDQFVDPLIESQVEFGQHSVSISTIQLSAQPLPLIRHFLVGIWKQKSWPLQAMTFEKWQQLADLICEPNKKGQMPKLTLPGNIQVERKLDQVIIRKR